MAGVSAGKVTDLLMRWQGGDREALEGLMPEVYDELHKLARGRLAREPRGATLCPTELVNEAYLRLEGQSPLAAWKDRAHFYGIVARLMRQVLVDYARRRGAEKRGGKALRVTFEEGLRPAPDGSEDLLLLDDALERLAEFDPRKARIIELRTFGGLTIEECAGLLALSTATVVNETRKARAWLHKELVRGDGRNDGS